MTKQEALEELKSRVRCADWIDEDYVDCVSTEALKIAIEALEKMCLNRLEPMVTNRQKAVRNRLRHQLLAATL